MLISCDFVESGTPESDTAFEDGADAFGTELPSDLPVAADSLAGLPGLAAFPEVAVSVKALDGDLAGRAVDDEAS